MTNPKTRKIRLDCLLVDRGLAESRQRAKALILAGAVLVGDRPADKAGSAVPVDAEIRIRGEENPYVSRGGLKLRGALETFGLSVRGLIALDVGASTGGFTDCLLQAEATKVYAIDVGYGQLAWKLREDPRVVCIERTNIRHYDGEGITDGIDIAVIDASFISLRFVIPPVLKLIGNGAIVLALIKPQFEVKRNEVGKRGVVRDPALHERVLAETVSFCRDLGLDVLKSCASPLTGPAGNREFFIYLKKPPEGEIAGDTGETRWP
ncbi:MAG: TlyA family RNA methyltransferase [Deltaproteobacteria bacterium]|nr:TlyA family RNA methyltransferase [Deltaproteobacteria bacterium]